MFTRIFFGIATGQTSQLTRRKCMANGCSEVQKTDLSESFSGSSASYTLLSEMDLTDADTRYYYYSTNSMGGGPGHFGQSYISSRSSSK